MVIAISTTIMPKAAKSAQIFMILSAIGGERGQPVALYTDPFKAKAEFEAINNMGNAMMGNLTAFLVAYMQPANGPLIEIEEIGRR